MGYSSFSQSWQIGLGDPRREAPQEDLSDLVAPEGEPDDGVQAPGLRHLALRRRLLTGRSNRRSKVLDGYPVPERGVRVTAIAARLVALADAAKRPAVRHELLVDDGVVQVALLSTLDGYVRSGEIGLWRR